MVNCFRKAGISSESQARSQSDDDPFKLLAAQLEEVQDRGEFPIDFIVDGYVDANEEVIILKAHLLKDSEIIVRVNQMQLDAAEHDDKNEEDALDAGKYQHQGGIKSIKLLKFFICAAVTKITESRRYGKKWQR